jgi:transcriptional antiterminator RfaH
LGVHHYDGRKASRALTLKLDQSMGADQLMLLIEHEEKLRWYVFATQTGKENLAVEQLKAQSFDVYIPMHLKAVSHARKRVTKPMPLFPGYGFVGFDQKRDSWRSINGTRGIKYLITQSERPVPIPEKIISSLKVLEDESGMVSFESQLKQNDRVRFVAGPFFGLIGRLSKVGRKGRVEILMNILNGDIQVKTHIHNIQPALK